MDRCCGNFKPARLFLVAPLDLARRRINRRHMAIRGTVISLRRSRAASPERIPLNKHRRCFLHLATALNGRHINVLRLRTIGSGKRSILTAHVARTDKFRIPAFHGYKFRINNRTAILIKSLGPVKLLNVLRAVAQRADGESARATEPQWLSVCIGSRHGEIFAQRAIR